MFMITLAWYLLKVILCSAILCGYYFFTLRDKIFHRWNRFYILAAVALSLLLPLIKINIFQDSVEQGGIVQIIKNINNSDDNIILLSRTNNIRQWLVNSAESIYITISIMLAAMLITSIYKIEQWKKRYPERKINSIRFFETDLDNAPCSFFSSIFWNDAIDLNSSAGKQILNHELTHVKQMHSHDKIFINIVLILFWINPVFWLFKKELNMIHEFIADQHAIQQNDSTSYGEMILQTLYPGRDFSITNNFFYSPLKRRLLMLTKDHHPKTNYIGRIISIPLLMLMITAFTVKIKDLTQPVETMENFKINNSGPVVTDFRNHVIATDSIPEILYKNKTVKNVTINSKDGFVTILYADGTIQKMSKKEFAKSNFPPPPPPQAPGKLPPPPPPPPADVIYVIDGEVSYGDEWKRIPSDEIESINVLKDKMALDKYGENGRKGVVEIITKKPNGKTKLPVVINSQQDVTVSNVPSGMLFTQVENAATFPGGNTAWKDFITNAIRANINKLGPSDNGTCRLRFIVEQDGSVTNVEALTMKGTSLSDVAVNAVKNGPKWNPATQNNHIVRAYHEQPVTFNMHEQ